MDQELTQYCEEQIAEDFRWRRAQLRRRMSDDQQDWDQIGNDDLRTEPRKDVKPIAQ